uniref:Uncharacterized protein n=1 Tax=Arundo donax TaxID=35708 RepID=A0A0A9EQ77_ARUDO
MRAPSPRGSWRGSWGL